MSPKPPAIVAWTSLALATAALPACASPPTNARGAVPDPVAAKAPDALEEADPALDEVVDLHNRERAMEDLPPLKPNLKLFAAAKVQADDMAEHGKMSHDGTDGSTPYERIERQKYKNRGSGENVAFGQPTPEAVVRAWMNSPGHRRNILGKYGEIGVARATSKDGEIYWCVDFGLPWPELDQKGAPAAVIEGLNRVRKDADARPLEVAPKLEAVARDLALAMAKRGKLDPDAGEGGSPIERIDRSGYKYKSVNLAFAQGQATPEDVVKTWTGRPEQKKAVLGPSTDVGVGCAADSEGIPYWCLILVTRDK